MQLFSENFIQPIGLFLKYFKPEKEKTYVALQFLVNMIQCAISIFFVKMYSTE